jgi:hypothetical protein
MPTTTYPKAKHLSLGYDPREDRLILTAHLQDGTSCKVLITRRLLSLLLECLSSELSSTHPAAAHSPNPDEVLQMEHVASVQGGKSEKGEQGSGQSQESIPTYLATSAQIESQEDGHIILGLKDDEPIAALLLSRQKTHQILERNPFKQVLFGLCLKECIPQ